MNKEKTITVRIAPSPTGNLHIGTARVALFNYLFAKQNNGKFILRIEDTDKIRSTKEFETNILESLAWLGLKYDEPFYRQSERKEIYTSYLEKLIKEGKAYVSEEKPKDENERSSVIRFKNPNKIVSFDDLIRGRVEFDTTELGDFVIAKSLEEPVFHLAVVVDDFLLDITHVIRGEDHISNTPRQILIQEAIGAPRPFYAHLPLILGKDRSKMSKRDSAVSLTVYRDRGYLKEALINYLAFLSWNPGTDKEIFNLKELIEEFDLKKVQKGGAIFDEKKLKWINKEHLKKLPWKDVYEMIDKQLNEKLGNNYKEICDKDSFIKIIFEKIEVFQDIDIMIKEGEVDYLNKDLKYEPTKLHWKNNIKPETKTHLENLLKILNKLTDWKQESIKESIWPYAEKEGRGDVLWPLRFSLSGSDRSPDPFILMSILGKEKTLERITRAIELL